MPTATSVPVTLPLIIVRALVGAATNEVDADELVASLRTPLAKAPRLLNVSRPICEVLPACLESTRCR